MLIDWFTVGAQVLNFVVLVWLMKRFLYHPILDAVDAREKRIADKLASADTKSKQANDQYDEFEDKNKRLDHQRAALLQAATDDAQAERERLLNNARQEAADFTEKRHEALRDELRHLQHALRTQTQQAVFSIARKALSDLAGADLEACMVDMLVTRLGQQSEEKKAALRAALQHPASSDMTSNGRIHVRSSFTLSSPQQTAVKTAIEELLGESTSLRIETSAEIVSGIELEVQGQKVAWSIEEYLQSMEATLTSLVAKPPTQKTKPKPRTSGAEEVTS